MDKTLVRQREDGTTYLQGCDAEYPVNGDKLVLIGWKAKSRLMDRATKIFIDSPELVARAKAELGITEEDGREADRWEIAGRVHAMIPGGIPGFVTAGTVETRQAA
ncbi:hypothetical protein [Arthrobacter sp. zg-Y1110]|uniref:hypothetical protein n=1 Tax=Arthrobacter sp. zg-Y1110 TaxID=2886932 RepID=UPI001D13DDF5|nr:hypothetical protein [Arthrobacter sp. zg-Y1110]MCC3292525.1 hypothetical protein [Arthrobacter sp. zg-Y1110]UWX87043.1 hypothetical protein N2K99_16970 [Arthrobacter sp. zg-Y1110]